MEEHYVAGFELSSFEVDFFVIQKDYVTGLRSSEVKRDATELIFSQQRAFRSNTQAAR
jgi:hypothetical protein